MALCVFHENFRYKSLLHKSLVERKCFLKLVIHIEVSLNHGWISEDLVFLVVLNSLRVRSQSLAQSTMRHVVGSWHLHDFHDCVKLVQMHCNHTLSHQKLLHEEEHLRSDVFKVGGGHERETELNHVLLC